MGLLALLAERMLYKSWDRFLSFLGLVRKAKLTFFGRGSGRTNLPAGSVLPLISFRRSSKLIRIHLG